MRRQSILSLHPILRIPPPVADFLWRGNFQGYPDLERHELVVAVLFNFSLNVLSC